MKVIVCGDRRWTDGEFIASTLDALHAETPFTLLIEGCGIGADMLAGDHEFFSPADNAFHTGWSRSRDVESRHFPALWRNYKRGDTHNPAGPIRNRQMLKVEPDLVVAFHDRFSSSRGTKDMVAISRKAQVPVILVSHEKAIRYDPALALWSP